MTAKEKIQNAIKHIEKNGILCATWPHDESPQVTNAGTENVYALNDSFYSIVTWNSKAKYHKDKEKTLTNIAQ